jgi:hypothetical protein
MFLIPVGGVVSYGRVTWSIVKTLIFMIVATGAHAISALGWPGLPPRTRGVRGILLRSAAAQRFR